MVINIYPTDEKEVKTLFLTPFYILAVSVIYLFNTIKEESHHPLRKGEEKCGVPGETPTYSVVFSMGIPQLSAFITFVMLGC